MRHDIASGHLRATIFIVANMIPVELYKILFISHNHYSMCIIIFP